MLDVPPAMMPIYPFGRPGEPIPVHTGAFHVGGRLLDGGIEFRLAPQPGLAWYAEARAVPSTGPVDISFQHPVGSARLTGHCSRHRRGAAAGWVDAAEVGSGSADVRRVLVQWLNLPALASVMGDLVAAPDGSEFVGRWSAELGGWSVILDRRYDHREVWEDVCSKGLTATTHVMEIRRTDGRSFTPVEIEPVLDALHLGMSFALGRWVAPALPVGLDAHGRRVWEQWGVRHCTPGAPAGLTWWSWQRDGDLAELLGLLVARFAEPDQRFSLRFLLASAVASAAGGLVEQRIMTAFAAIEHLMWTRLVTIGGMSKTKYRDDGFYAHQKLSTVLAEAGIDGALDRDVLTALRNAAERRPVDVPRTGPAIACHVRNLLVHPTDHEVELYRRDDRLIEQAWHLVQHYLVLLVLHHLGYGGRYLCTLGTTWSDWDHEPVPWATTIDR